MKPKFLLFATMFSILGLSACSDDDGPDDTKSPNDSYYLLQTMNEISQTKPGFISSYPEFPSGTVDNTAQPTAYQGQANEGWITYNGTVFKKFNASFERGIYRLNVSSEGRISYGPAIKTGNTVNGSGNFVIENDTKGYYWDANAPWEIQTFNPSTVQRTGKLEEDFESILKKSDENIKFQGIGQHFLAIKNGKLYADIVYSSGTGFQSGMFNDVFDDVYIAVIDLQSGKYEKTITIENTGAIAFINDNEMYSFDTNGDLYILCQGQNGPLGENSKIVRIKANETDIDSWELAYKDLYPSDKGKFTNVFAKDGKLVVTANDVELTTSPINNINTGEIWKFYVIETSTKQATAVSGVDLSTNAGGAYAAFELDGRTLLRVNTPSKPEKTGFYELNGTTATQLFRVSGGHVTGFTKAKVNN